MKHMLLVLLAAASAYAQIKPLTNADVIEMSKAGVAPGVIITSIQTTPVKFDVSPEGLISLTAGGVRDSVITQMIRESQRSKFSSAFGVATGTFPVQDAAGKTIRLSAWIRAENVLNGYAGLWWRVDGENGKQLAFDNSLGRFIDGIAAPTSGTVRGATGTADWKLYRLELPVATGAKNINFGALLTGTGTAWVDGMKVELDGAPYSNPQLFDLDFESTMAKGFYTGGPGYSVGVDSSTAYSGKQSLRMKFIGDGGAAAK
jgi:hypothetical protein